MISSLWKSGRKARNKQVKKKKMGRNNENKRRWREGNIILI